ncbi:MAG: CsbD family protein [Frankiaceae bacterium]
MSDNRAEHKLEELKGDAKETYGKAVGSDELVAEGKGDQASGRVKQAGDDLKHAAKKVTGQD